MYLAKTWTLHRSTYSEGIDDILSAFARSTPNFEYDLRRDKYFPEDTSEAIYVMIAGFIPKDTANYAITEEIIRTELRERDIKKHVFIPECGKSIKIRLGFNIHKMITEYGNPVMVLDLFWI